MMNKLEIMSMLHADAIYRLFETNVMHVVCVLADRSSWQSLDEHIGDLT